MHSRKTCVATLLAAVKYAGELAGHIVRHPFDFTVQTPLIKAAKEIGDCAQALRQIELRKLSQRLIAAAQMDLTTREAVAELNAAMDRITAIAETFGDVSSAKNPVDAKTQATNLSDPFASLTGTHWVKF